MILVLACQSALSRAADESGERQYAYGWLGALDSGTAWHVEDDDGATLSRDLGTLPFAGGAAQRVWGDRLQYGYEGGGLITWKSDSSAFAATSNTLRVKVRSSLFALDLFLGGAVAAQPVDWLRVHAAAGPSLGWAWADHDGDDRDGDASVAGAAGSASGPHLRLNTSDNDVSLGWYARVGADVLLRDGFSVGFGARYTDHRYAFGDAGEIDLDGVQWLLTFGQSL